MKRAISITYEAKNTEVLFGFRENERKGRYISTRKNSTDYVLIFG